MLTVSILIYHCLNNIQGYLFLLLGQIDLLQT